MRSARAKNQLPAGKRSSCLGCIVQSLLVFIAAGVIAIIGYAVLFPWGNYLGGKFHILPYWQGFGKLHSSVSGDYVMLVRFVPSSSRYSSYVSGVGYVCTPRGERIYLKLTGTMRKGLKKNTDGEKISIKLFRPQMITNLSKNPRPRIEFSGYWKNPDLVMETDSISEAFQPDGSVYYGGDRNRNYKKEVLPITFVAGSSSQFESACSEIHH
jgi:hypothetical protein